MDYKVGDRVRRIEDREVVGATILQIVDMGSMGYSVELQYDEGGTGWWPVSCIEPEVVPEP
jgi:hypothetical protein